MYVLFYVPWSPKEYYTLNGPLLFHICLIFPKICEGRELDAFLIPSHPMMHKISKASALIICLYNFKCLQQIVIISVQYSAFYFHLLIAHMFRYFSEIEKRSYLSHWDISKFVRKLSPTSFQESYDVSYERYFICL